MITVPDNGKIFGNEKRPIIWVFFYSRASVAAYGMKGCELIVNVLGPIIDGMMGNIVKVLEQELVKDGSVDKRQSRVNVQVIGSNQFIDNIALYFVRIFNGMLYVNRLLL
jgi:hypothetical protein